MPGPGPDEREPERELDLASPARALAVDEAEPLGGDLRLRHPGPDDAAHVVHRRGGDLVREPHPLDLLRGLDRPRLDEQRRRVDRARKRVEPAPSCTSSARRPCGRRPASRATARARPSRTPRRADAASSSVRSDGRPRVVGDVPVDEPHVRRPGRPRRVVGRRLEAEQRRLALAGEDDGVPALHAPEVRQVEDVVGRARDDRVDPLPGHQRPHPVELRVVPRPRHSGHQTCRVTRLLECVNADVVLGQ